MSTPTSINDLVQREVNREIDANATEGDFLQNANELEKLKKDQLDGNWEYKGPNDPKEKEAFEEEVFLKVKRCIELTALLRRTNTGPAKATGARGKRKASSKEPPDLAAIRSSLLD